MFIVLYVYIYLMYLLFNNSLKILKCTNYSNNTFPCIPFARLNPILLALIHGQDQILVYGRVDLCMWICLNKFMLLSEIKCIKSILRYTENWVCPLANLTVYHLVHHPLENYRLNIRRTSMEASIYKEAMSSCKTKLWRSIEQ